MSNFFTSPGVSKSLVRGCQQKSSTDKILRTLARSKKDDLKASITVKSIVEWYNTMMKYKVKKKLQAYDEGSAFNPKPY